MQQQMQVFTEEKETVPVIALIGAMEREVHAYRELATNLSHIYEGNFFFSEGDLFGKHVVIALSGQGKVLTALTTQRLLDKYHPQAVIMTGVAGALKSDLEVGDIVVSTDCVQHDLDVTILGFPRGTSPDTNYRFIAADSRLINLALTAPSNEHRLVTGRILSGDQFFTEEETIQRPYLFDELNGSAIEMEGAALAQVCAFNYIPFVIIRTVCSELEGDQRAQYRKSLTSVVENSLGVVEAILRQW
jgi:adenosylhomocysteine nucleosidase